jgi:hypothetical protein
VNSSDICKDRWEVTTAANTALGSFYFLVHTPSGKSVKVSTFMGSRRRTYLWSSLARKTESVPRAAQREVDRAIARYLSSEHR